MRSILVSAICIVILVACKKKTEPLIDDTTTPTSQVKGFDTIKPLPYFPVYPGSYWKYVDSYSMTTTYTTAANYKKDAYAIQYPGPTPTYYLSDTFYVPYYNDVAIWGYKERTSSPAQTHSLSPFRLIVSDSLDIGTSWSIINEFYGTITASIRSKDTSMVINGHNYTPVIIVRKKTNFMGGANGSYQGTTDYYYAKDIGLIKTKTVLNTDPNSYGITDMDLVEYHINK